MTEAQDPAIPTHQAAKPAARPGWDALLIALLTFAHLQILGLAVSAALPLRLQDVLRHPILGRLMPETGVQAMGEVGPRPGEPLGLILFATALGAVLIYFVIDLLPAGTWRRRGKWIVLTVILIAALFLPTAELILLRQGSGPASYTHDGGVIQTESTIEYLLSGKNPYVEDYTETPMAEWGFNEYRTALYHYPYLPWTFLFSAPFFLLGNTLGFYDQRLVYLLLLAITLVLAPRLVNGERNKLAFVALLALNPLMALDVIFGQNDVFILSWILLSLVAWKIWDDGVQSGAENRWWMWGAMALFGLACAGKPTAWFLAPFFGLLLLRGDRSPGRTWGDLVRAIPVILARAWPALLIFAGIMLPYILWDVSALYDDVWRWSSGQGETGYQIWGWGGSNFVLVLGLVTDRFDQWPFWVTELLIAVPLMLWFLRRQQRDNTLSNAAWHYAVFLFGFFYASRFLNENYLGYILAFLAIGLLTSEPEQMKES